MKAKTIDINSHLQVDERINFLGKVYAGVGGQAVLAAISAFGLLSWSFPMEHPWMMLFLLIGSIFIVQSVRHVPGINVLALGFFAVLTGASITPLINVALAVNPGTIAVAFMGTAAAFFGLTFYVFKSRKDFTFMGGVLFAILIGLIVTGLLNVFLIHSPVVHLIGSLVGVALFAAYILYDTSNILRNYDNDEWVAASLTLYLDIFLLFQDLLSVLLQASSNE